MLLKNGAEFINVDEGFACVCLCACEAAAESVTKLHRRQECRQRLGVSGLQVGHDLRVIHRMFGAMFHKLDEVVFSKEQSTKGLNWLGLK